MASKLCVGIVGLGMVGQPIKKYLEKERGFRRGVNLFCFDTDPRKKCNDSMDSADIVFVCVPTPYDPKKGFTLSYVESAIRVLPGKKVIVIKSTVLPGTAEKLQKKYSRHAFIFNPEFLREKIAYRDFTHPDRHIVGVTKKSKRYAQAIIRLLPKSKHNLVMRATEAELVKYMGNSFLSLKIVFANEFYDLCKSLGINYENVREGFATDSRIGGSHLGIFHEGYRGYGGSCFPKDVNACIQFAKTKHSRLSLLEKMRELNRALLKKSGVSEERFLHFLHRPPSKRIARRHR